MLSDQVSKLSDKLEDQKVVVSKAVEAYKTAVEDWEKDQIIKAALDIASNLFDLAFAFATPASAFTALKDLGEMVQRIQKLVKIFDAVIKAYKSFQSLPKNPQDVVDALNGIVPKDLEMPTSEEWSEMKVNMDATLARGPNNDAKITLSQAFAILVLRGQALIEVQNVMQAKLSELSAAYSNKRVHDRQKKRLSDLSAKFDVAPEDLDVEAVDLIGFSGQLVFFQRQMLVVMASTLVIQDRALQYEYLQPPLSLESFSFTSLQVSILTQAQSINRGLTVQPMPETQPEPIVYEVHGVRPEQLTGTNTLAFNISLNKREFSSYNYVRVEKVEAEVGGIKSTKSGKYYTVLRFEGDPFMDRGFNGESLTFKTVPRVYTFLHDVSTSSHCKDASFQSNPLEAKAHFPLLKVATDDSDNPFAGKVSNITPFSTWRVSLPSTESNEGIVFDDCPRGLTVRLTFNIYAQLKEGAPPLPERMRNAFILRSQGIEVPLNMRHIYSSSPRSAPPVPSPLGSSVSDADVLNAMLNKSVCEGWDVVFSMSEEQVNSNLLQQYEDRKNNEKFFRETGQQTYTNKQKTSRIIFNLKFKAPKLQFLLNNNNEANVSLPIISGHYEFYFYGMDDHKWHLNAKGDVTEKQGFSINGNIPLGYLEGVVSGHKSVVLKLNGGSFSSKNFSPGDENPDFQLAITDYFTNLPDGYNVYTLGTLDTTKISGLDSLTPKDFLLNVYHTKSDRYVLQLFIATSGKLQNATQLNLLEPYSTTYQSSLIISSKIFFSNILPASIGDGGVGLTFSSMEPKDDENLDKAWTTSTTAGSISTPFGDTFISSTTSGNGMTGYTTVSVYVTMPDGKATLDLSKMNFTSGKWDVKMSMDKSEDISFKVGSQTCGPAGPCSSIDYNKTGTATVQITMSADLSFQVTGTGQDQQLQLSPVSSTHPLVVTGTIHASGNCKCDDNQLQKKFQAKLSDNAEPKLKTVLNRQFKAVSLFALKNILFPEKNLIDMKAAYVPGDLVIFGNFASDTLTAS